VSYQTAWLKANHPVEFMAAAMNCDIHLTDKLAAYKQEVDRLGIEIKPPCVNRSGASFTVRRGKIVYALGALKGVGIEAMRLIEAGRGETPFADLFDLGRRVDLRRIGRRPLEMLARAGAFDALDRNRRRVLAGLETLVGYSAAIHDERASAQVSLFGEGASALALPRLPSVEDFPPHERLAQEQLAVGFYLSGHPLDDYAGALRRERIMTRADLLAAARAGAAVGRVAGTVASRDERKSARGNRFAYVRLSDPTGIYEVVVFGEVLETAREYLEPGRNVVLGIEATLEEEEVKLRARSVEPIEAALRNAARVGLRVYLTEPEAAEVLAGRLATARREVRGGGSGPVSLVLLDPGLPGEVECTLPEQYPITPAVIGAIKHIPGVLHLEEA
jgi:DNA polymerase III subunit alpha